MPNDAYESRLILKLLLYFAQLYLCCEGLRKTLKLQKISKYLKLEGNWGKL